MNNVCSDLFVFGDPNVNYPNTIFTVKKGFGFYTTLDICKKVKEPKTKFYYEFEFGSLYTKFATL